MITLKIDLLSELKKHGYSTYRIRKEKLFSEVQLQAFRKNVMPSISALDTACCLLSCQPSALIRFTADPGFERYQTEKSEDPHQGIGSDSGTKNPPGA